MVEMTVDGRYFRNPPTVDADENLTVLVLVSRLHQQH
jgi:hypothetical protein